MDAPAVGDVLPYQYLWRREYDAGEDAGRKLRPAAVIAIVVKPDNAGMRVAILPITHSSPVAGQRAVEIPAAVKRSLGLDGARSWIVCDEFNDFIWPGYDLGRTSDGEEIYGRLPRGLLKRVRDEFLGAVKLGKAKPVNRD